MDDFSETPKITQWLIDHSGGLIKNEHQANWVLLGLVVVIIIISIFLIFGGGEVSPRSTEYKPSEGYGGRELPDDFR